MNQDETKKCESKAGLFAISYKELQSINLTFSSQSTLVVPSQSMHAQAVFNKSSKSRTWQLNTNQKTKKHLKI